MFPASRAEVAPPGPITYPPRLPLTSLLPLEKLYKSLVTQRSRAVRAPARADSEG